MEFGIDKVAAARSRARQGEHSTDAYYSEQEHILAQWHWGKPPPEQLVLGELPYVGLKGIRLDRD
mgnify:CR=1 FL=1